MKKLDLHSHLAKGPKMLALPLALPGQGVTAAAGKDLCCPQ